MGGALRGGAGLQFLKMTFKLVFSAAVSLSILTVISYQYLTYRGQQNTFTQAVAMRPISTQQQQESIREGLDSWQQRVESESSQAIRRTGEPKRSVYLMALGYSGQQAAGINAFTSFQCWAAYLAQPVQLVEPVIRKSRISSSFEVNPGAMELSDFFDIEHLNSASKTAGFPQLMKRKEFLEHGSKDVIFIEVDEQSGEEVIIWSADELCYSVKAPRKQLNRIIQYGYCVRKIINMKSALLTRMKIWQLLGNWNYRNVTVIISNWKGPASPQPDCKHMGRQSSKSRFHPSPRLLRDASVYINSYYAESSVPYNAVMIRLERAAIVAERFPQARDYSVQGCLQEVVDVERKLAASTDKAAVIAADIGKYGSNSWDWAVTDKEKLTTGMEDTKEIMQRLLRSQMSFEKWEMTFVEAAGGVTDRGYIAALQRTISSKAKCLILMGGGNFQDLALQEYLRIHGDREDRCVHLVCVENEAALKGRISDS